MFRGYLTQQQLGELYNILVCLIRPGDEDAFLARLPKHFVAGLPGATTATFAARLHWKLQELNGIAALEDGAVPLHELLDTLCLVYPDRQESVRLRALRDAIPTLWFGSRPLISVEPIR